MSLLASWQSPQESTTKGKRPSRTKGCLCSPLYNQHRLAKGESDPGNSFNHIDHYGMKVTFKYSCMGNHKYLDIEPLVGNWD